MDHRERSLLNWLAAHPALVSVRVVPASRRDLYLPDARVVFTAISSDAEVSFSTFYCVLASLAAAGHITDPFRSLPSQATDALIRRTEQEAYERPYQLNVLDAEGSVREIHKLPHDAVTICFGMHHQSHVAAEILDYLGRPVWSLHRATGLPYSYPLYVPLSEFLRLQATASVSHASPTPVAAHVPAPVSTAPDAPSRARRSPLPAERDPEPLSPGREL